MILLVDNYDSFSYNLYQMIGAICPDIRVIRNDQLTLEEIRKLRPDRIILSPGPGRPEGAGITMDIAKTVSREVPTLGVCLGHQAICAAYGATVTHAKRLMHGKQSRIFVERDCPLFDGCPEQITVARYHSLAAEPGTVPKQLQVTAWTEEGEIMAVQHRDYPIFGVQFHPESIMTPDGTAILENFIYHGN